MPLRKGSSKAVVSQNIREFHTGPTYARTAAKFGAAKANKQAVAVALSSARKTKGSQMAKSGHEDGMAGEKGMSPRKAMASGAIKGGSFGAGSYDSMNGGSGMHPDHAADTGMKGAMAEGDRSTPPAIHHTKGMHPAQAAPRHGPTMDTWGRGGKV